MRIALTRDVSAFVHQPYLTRDSDVTVKLARERYFRSERDSDCRSVPVTQAIKRLKIA